jgi:hypothetical protein
VTLTNSAGDGYFRAASGEALYLLTLSTGQQTRWVDSLSCLSATGYYMKPQHYHGGSSQCVGQHVRGGLPENGSGGDQRRLDAADNLEADYDGTGYAKTNSTTKLHADYDAARRPLLPGLL